MLKSLLSLAAILALFATLAAVTIAEEEAPDKGKKDPVRALKHKAFPMMQAGAPAGPVLKTREELEKFAGAEAAKEIGKDVDFAKESVVAMQYETGGPPFGQPAWRIKKKDDKLHVEFFVKEPEIGPDEARGLALKLGLDFFAVPKGSEVKITAAE
jgi:hypothetical protein